uniref:CCHC-type domain-containing protein n=1 Tax=Cyanistes caeruleus TaxID=156563 RepID=A0A8C0V9Y3_CYACU
FLCVIHQTVCCWLKEGSAHNNVVGWQNTKPHPGCFFLGTKLRLLFRPSEAGISRFARIATHRITGFSSSKVCFHCREPGHGVADCPAVLESQDMGTGICYRCGSTEHDISKCRAKVDPAAGPFPYAKCFICGEMGHLSRSCPDNPKGLYAEGECTDSLHLVKLNFCVLLTWYRKK